MRRVVHGSCSNIQVLTTEPIGQNVGGARALGQCRAIAVGDIAAVRSRGK